MKKFFSIITIFTALAVIMAACTHNPSNAPTLNSSDTTGFAQFQEWKAMQDKMEAEKAMAAAVKQTKVVVYTPAPTNSGTMSSSTTNEAKAPEKKGWSKAAKYGVIGGGTGVVLGSVINKKNRVVGGTVGGVVLGGLGYLLGRSKDKKEGRY
jgi:pantothenate kinase